MEWMGSDEICIQILGAWKHYLFSPTSIFPGRIRRIFLCIPKPSDLIFKIQDAVDENDVLNVFVFQSNGLMKVTGET
jgi:hypothetical protein